MGAVLTPSSMEMGLSNLILDLVPPLRSLPSVPSLQTLDVLFQLLESVEARHFALV